jgi:hypothetical protein
MPTSGTVPTEVKDFLLKDYEIKVKWLTDQYQRMWTRFNFFLTLETAIIGGKIFFASGEGRSEETGSGLSAMFSEPAALWLASVGLFLSVVWYVFGAQDRQLVRIYEKVLVTTVKQTTGELLLTKDSELAKYYRGVREVEETAKDLKREDQKESWIERLLLRVSGWRAEAISTTRLVSLFPLLLSVLWLAYLLVLIYQLR